MLRARLNPSDVSVIPNAVDTRSFTPDASARPDHTKRINIVIISRLVYRKGMDLVAKVLPVLCERYPQMYFIIGGDGPKKLILEETVQKYRLHDRVEFLGAVPSKDVRDVLIRGHIFLNCSLTEAFCIAILEAAACGLLVVATKVGGVPEVLPPDMIVFADATAQSLISAVEDTLPRVPHMDRDRIQSFHDRVRLMYSWENVAERTEKVYERIWQQPQLPLIERFRRYYGCGPWAGKLFVLVVALDYLFFKFLEWVRPREMIDEAVEFPFYEEGADHSAPDTEAAAAAVGAGTDGSGGSIAALTMPASVVQRAQSGGGIGARWQQQTQPQQQQTLPQPFAGTASLPSATRSVEAGDRPSTSAIRGGDSTVDRRTGSAAAQHR